MAIKELRGGEMCLDFIFQIILRPWNQLIFKDFYETALEVHGTAQQT